MRRSLLLAAAVFLTLVACNKGSGAEAGAAPAPSGSVLPAAVTPANIALGDSIYHNGACQRCHGQKGVGAQNGPSLVTTAWLHGDGSFDAIAATITNGVLRTAIKDPSRRFQMNPRGGPMNLNEAQVQAVAAYVYSISREKR
jgi:mono/diheme cytochrome c family protein